MANGGKKSGNRTFMIHSELVSQNRIAQFAARFEIQANGSVIYYHPDRAYGGLPCTQAECEQLIQEYAANYVLSLRWMQYWAIVSGVMLGILEASGLWIPSRWLQFVIILVPTPIVFYSWYQAGQKPLQLLRGRLRCALPRTVESAFWQRVNALPASLFIMMLLPSAGLVYYGIEGGWEKIDASSLLIIASSITMTVIWLYAKFKRN
jgi:hypothetical protein